MKLYTDVFNGSEFFSDSKEIRPVLLEDGTDTGMVEVDGAWMTKGGDTVDIGCGGEFGGAADDEKVDDTVERVVDLIEIHQLNEATFASKKDWKEQFGMYAKKLLKWYKDNKSEEEVEKFKGQMKASLTWVQGKFSDLQFFSGSDMDSMFPESNLAYAYYKEGATTPTFVFFLPGLKCQKM